MIPDLIPPDLHEPVRNQQQPVLVPSHPQPAHVLPEPMSPTQHAVRRSSRANKGNTSRYGDYITGDGFDDATSSVQGLRRDDRDDAPAPAQVVREHAVGDVPAKLP